jgi:hypothetical protein
VGKHIEPACKASVYTCSIPGVHVSWGLSLPEIVYSGVTSPREANIHTMHLIRNLISVAISNIPDVSCGSVQFSFFTISDLFFRKVRHHSRQQNGVGRGALSSWHASNAPSMLQPRFHSIVPWRLLAVGNQPSLPLDQEQTRIYAVLLHRTPIRRSTPT